MIAWSFKTQPQKQNVMKSLEFPVALQRPVSPCEIDFAIDFKVKIASSWFFAKSLH